MNESTIKVWQCFSTHKVDGKPVNRNVGEPFKGTKQQSQAWINLMYDVTAVACKEADIMELSKIKFHETQMSGVTAMVKGNGKIIGMVSKPNGSYMLQEGVYDSEPSEVDHEDLQELGFNETQK